MRIGIVSDIHGNLAALEAALAGLNLSGVDRIICLGDAVDPFPGSKATIELLERLAIPILRGNHEDYVVTAAELTEGTLKESSIEPIHVTPNWEPVRVLARSLSQEFIKRLKNLPLTLSLDEGLLSEVVFCHASPSSNQSGWRYATDERLNCELSAHPACTMVCGHWHMPETRVWQNKQLITCGSVGIPLRGRVESEFLIVERRGSEWHSNHGATIYDNTSTLEDYRNLGWVAAGGPLAWMLYDEVRTAQRRVVPFNQWLKTNGITQPSMSVLKEHGRQFLKEIGTWSEIAPYT